MKNSATSLGTNDVKHGASIGSKIGFFMPPLFSFDIFALQIKT